MSYYDIPDPYPPLKREDLDHATSLFGLVIRDRRRDNINDLVDIYIEDDENYYYKFSMDVIWVNDLEKMLEFIKKNTKLRGKSKKHGFNNKVSV